MHVANFETFLILSVDHIADYVTKKLIILWISVFLSTLAHYNPPSAFLIQESESASSLSSLRKSIRKKGSRQAIIISQ